MSDLLPYFPWLNNQGVPHRSLYKRPLIGARITHEHSVLWSRISLGYTHEHREGDYPHSHIER